MGRLNDIEKKLVTDIESALKQMAADHGWRLLGIDKIANIFTLKMWVGPNETLDISVTEQEMLATTLPIWNYLAGRIHKSMEEYEKSRPKPEEGVIDFAAKKKERDHSNHDESGGFAFEPYDYFEETIGFIEHDTHPISILVCNDCGTGISMSIESAKNLAKDLLEGAEKYEREGLGEVPKE